MRANVKCVVLFGLVLFCVGIPSLQAHWETNGTAVAVMAADQSSTGVASDGLGGAIIFYQDQRNGNYDIYAQRIDAHGNLQWPSAGVPICTAPGSQFFYNVCSDGEGGAMTSWTDSRSGGPYIYAQRIDASGTVLWGEDGVAVSTAAAASNHTLIVSDGAGGAIISWNDSRNGGQDLYAQRIDAGGSECWTADGVAIYVDPGVQQNHEITSDGFGGAILTWWDYRSPLQMGDIYAQRIDADGNILWALNGTPVRISYFQADDNPVIVSTGSGGAIIAWRREPYDIYAQMIDSDGDTLWPGGVAICIATGTQRDLAIVPDDVGGAIISWEDPRNGNDDIFAQRIDASGTVLWTANGVPVCTDAADNFFPETIADGDEGAIISWNDDRGEDRDVYAQKIDSDGNPVWTVDGVAISAATDDQFSMELATDGNGGAILAWIDERGVDRDTYAQRIESDGHLGSTAPEIYEVRDVPGDQGGYVNLAWFACRLDVNPGGAITHYTIWRAIDPTAAAPMIDGGATVLASASELPPGTSGPVIRTVMLDGEIFFWELIDSQDTYYLEGYSKVLPTLFDSSAVCTENHYFQVIAHTSDPGTFWISAPDTGHSVDNLSPGQPLGLAGEASAAPPALTIHWHPNLEPDLSHYAVYRGANEDFIPGPGNLIGSINDTMYLDDDEQWSLYYYKISALDVHDNESSHALLRSEDISGGDTPDTPLASCLHQNFPNPFNPSTEIIFDLNRPANIRLRIYDTSGRLVRTVIEGRREAGRYREIWSGHDGSGRAVASGVYYYRLSAGSFVQTRKMVLMR